MKTILLVVPMHKMPSVALSAFERSKLCPNKLTSSYIIYMFGKLHFIGIMAFLYLKIEFKVIFLSNHGDAIQIMSRSSEPPDLENLRIQMQLWNAEGNLETETFLVSYLFNRTCLHCAPTALSCRQTLPTSLNISVFKQFPWLQVFPSLKHTAFSLHKVRLD